MRHFDPSGSGPHVLLVSGCAAPASGAHGRRRRVFDALREAHRAFWRRLKSRHDSPGARSGWRAIFDEPDETWSFYDEEGRYCTTVRLNERPRGDVVDFIATIYEQGFDAGRASEALGRD